MANQYFTCTLNASVSGQNVSAYMNYSRSGTYTYQDTVLPVPTMTIDGTNYSDNNFKNRVASGVPIGSVNTSTFTKACANGNRTVTFTCGSGLRSDFQGTWSKTVTVNYTPPSSPPTGLAVSLTGRTWNSVTGTVSITGWGTPVGANRYLEMGIRKTNSTGFSDKDRYQPSSQGIGTSTSLTVNNSSRDRNYGTIRGCQAFLLEAYANNGTVNSSIAPGTTYYLPPAPLQTLSVNTQTWVSNTQTKVKLNIVGGNSTNNEDVTVTTQYRYQVNSGDWSAWTSAGTGKPWDTKNPEITVTAGATINIQARQVYQSQNSKTKTLSFTAFKNPTGNFSITSVTKDTVVCSVTMTNAGASSSSTRGVEVGYAATNTASYANTVRRVRGNGSATVGTASSLTLTPTSETRGSAPFPVLSPNKKFYIGMWLNNGSWTTCSNDGRGSTTNWTEVITSPETNEVTVNSLDVVASTGTVTANLHCTQLGLGGGASTLTPKYRYSINGGTTWSNWVSLTSNTLEQNFTITGLPFNTLVTVESKTTGVRDSTTSTMTFRTNAEPILIDTFDWSFDELRRNTITWRLNIKSGYTVAKNAVLTIKSHNVNIMNSSTALSATAQESLPNVYKPNETLAWSLTVSTSGISQTITGDITMPRPILGITIGPDGDKRYITDMIKGGGSVTADDFILDARYDKFKIKT